MAAKSELDGYILDFLDFWITSSYLSDFADRKMSALLSRLLKILSPSSLSPTIPTKRLVDAINSLNVEKKKVLFQISLSDFSSASSLRRLEAAAKPFGSPRSERDVSIGREREEKEKNADGGAGQNLHLEAFHPLQIAGHLRSVFRKRESVFYCKYSHLTAFGPIYCGSACK